MIENRSGGCLAAKALKSSRLARQRIRQEFKGYEATAVRVFCLVNPVHAAATEFLDDAVMREDLVDREEMPKFTIIHLTNSAADSQRIATMSNHLEPELSFCPAEWS